VSPSNPFTVALRAVVLALGLSSALAAAMPAGAEGDELYARARAAYDEAAASGNQKHPGYDEAFEIWEQMAADGDARQQVAMQHVRAGAEGGYPVAQSFMGWVVETGDGTMAVTGDEAALGWWRKGAQGGHCTAVRRMSRAYRNGELGLERDAAKADAWAAREDGCFKN
jgi:TPR repeat protein